MSTCLSTLAGITILLTAVVGCGPRSINHEHVLALGKAHHPGLSTALLVPVNETEKIPTGLDIADDVIDELIVDYLESKGVSVERLSAVAYRRASRIAIKQAEKKVLSGESGTTSGSVAYSDVIPLLLDELKSEAQIVVVPNVAIRQSEYTGGRMMKWDGVKRREKIGPGRTITGATPVASLHTIVFDKEGEQLFSAYGGLDAIYETNIREKKYDLKADLLQNEDFLAEGICVSFHPFFGLEDEC